MVNAPEAVLLLLNSVGIYNVGDAFVGLIQMLYNNPNYIAFEYF